MERVGLRDVLIKKTAVGFSRDAFQQLGDGCLDVADKPKINSRAAANVFGILVDLYLLNPVAGEEF